MKFIAAYVLQFFSLISESLGSVVTHVHYRAVITWKIQGRNHVENLFATSAKVGKICPPWWG